MSENRNIRDLHGTPYQIGCLSGSYFNGRVKIELDDIVSFMARFPQAVFSVVQQMKQLQQKYPYCYEETIGKADGLGIDRHVYMMLMHPEILQEGHESCTTIMVKNADGSVSLCHNEDDVFRKGNLSFVRVHTQDGWFITNDMYNMPLGNGICIHQSGLIRTINYCHDTAHTGISRYYAQRHIAQAGTIADLKRKAMEMKPASGYHVNVIDCDHRHGQSLEVRNDGIHGKDLSLFLVHTNHFMYDIPKDQYCTQPIGNSIFRYETVQQQMQMDHAWNMDRLKQILSIHTEDPATSIFQCHSDANRTLFQFSYDGVGQKAQIRVTEDGNTFAVPVSKQNDTDDDGNRRYGQ